MEIYKKRRNGILSIGYILRLLVLVGIRTYVSEETGALDQRLRLFGHATCIMLNRLLKIK